MFSLPNCRKNEVRRCGKLPQTYSMQNLYEREMCFRMGKGSLPAKEAKYTGYKIGDISIGRPRAAW